MRYPQTYGTTCPKLQPCVRSAFLESWLAKPRMTGRVPSYLRTHRKRWSLTCEELGELLGVSDNAVRKYELGERAIPMRVLIACELIFKTPAREIFPAVYEAVEKPLSFRALALSARLANADDPASNRKFELVSSIPRSQV